MTFMTFVNCDLFNAYACRSSERCFYEMNLFGNPTFLWAVGGSIIGQLAVIYFPPLQEVFQTESLSFTDLLYIILLSSTVLMLDTLRKKFFSSVFGDVVLPGTRSNKGYSARHHKKKEDSEQDFSKSGLGGSTSFEFGNNNVTPSKNKNPTVRSRAAAPISGPVCL
mmetsp:Transcript_67204/g.99533  ORF Transcript_67204/g.99533 Transcript_67204/m.99533 type:complete len:166 (+) Transcript_67204:3229-3726(+)